MPCRAEELASWVVGLGPDHIPERVLEKARFQAASVLAAVLAGAGTAGARAAASLAKEGTGPAPVLPAPARRRARVEDALLAAACASMAYDFDDYLVFGHTGHSAVLVPLLLATETGASAREVLAAQVVANEVGGRLGAAMVLGPHNGQLWAPIHSLAGACAAARLLGLSEGETADAIGIALYLAPHPVLAGFMGPASKLLTAAWPAVQGLVAARLARGGMSGAHDILDAPNGFLEETCLAPLPRFFSGFGTTWVTDTLAYKAHPGCAYLGSAVDATLTILDRLGERGGLDPARVDSVDVRASALTLGMEHLAGEGPLTPIRVNFSVPRSLALTLLRGRLTPADLDEASLAAVADRLEALARRVVVRHDWEMTLALVRSLDRTLHVGRLLRHVDRAALRRAGEEARRRTGLSLGATPREIVTLLVATGRVAAGLARGVLSRARAVEDDEPYDLARADLEEFTLPLAAEVTLHIDGRAHREKVFRPRGTPGDSPASFRVVEEKLLCEVARRGAGAKGRALMDMLRRFEEHPPTELLEAVCEIVALSR